MTIEIDGERLEHELHTLATFTAQDADQADSLGVDHGTPVHQDRFFQ